MSDNNNNNRIFVGKTNVVTTKFGEIIKVSFGPKDFETMQNNRNEAGWVNLEIKGKRDGGRYLQIQEKYTPKTAVNDGDDMPF